MKIYQRVFCSSPAGSRSGRATGQGCQKLVPGDYQRYDFR